MTSPELFLTTEEVAGLVRQHPNTVMRWAREGRIQGAIKLPGGRWRFRREAIEAFLSGEQPASVTP